MRRLYWSELTTPDLAGLDPEATIAVLPVAAIEQHGPHLPLGTDTFIADGMIAEVMRRLPEELSILVLPTAAIGKSNEHLDYPGTLTHAAETAIRAWSEVGEAVHRAGLRKLVIVSSHGGNVEVVGIVARELRVRLGMLVVGCAWGRFGLPPGLYAREEAAFGIHAGCVETSLMLHLRPDLVRVDEARDFTPATIEIARDFTHLRPTGHIAFAWMAQDLHPSGAIGDASGASAEKGRATAAFQAGAFIELLHDVARFSLDRLAPPSG